MKRIFIVALVLLVGLAWTEGEGRPEGEAADVGWEDLELTEQIEYASRQVQHWRGVRTRLVMQQRARTEAEQAVLAEEAKERAEAPRPLEDARREAGGEREGAAGDGERP